MTEFGDFGDRSDEEIVQLQRAAHQIDMSGHAARSMDLLAERGMEELGADADDVDRIQYYILNDPRHEAAVKGEYEAFSVAVDALILCSTRGGRRGG